MSRGNRQRSRRDERAATKRQRSAATRRKSEDNESLLEAADRLASDMTAPAAKLPAHTPAVVRRLRKHVRDSDVIEPYEALLRDHPGRPSDLKIEALFVGGLMGSWNGFSYLRTDGLSNMLRLSPTVQDDFGMRKKDGKRGQKYRTYHKQTVRLEDALRNQRLSGGPHDLSWLEHQMMSAAVPDHIKQSVEAVAVDETAFPSWHVMQCDDPQIDVNQAVRNIFKERNPKVILPDMSSPEMRSIAAEELGVPLGEDGRIERTTIDRDVRSGYRTPTNKQKSEFFIGYSSTDVVATRTHTLSRNSDKITRGPLMKQYILATSINPANSNPGPVGFELMQRAMSIAPNIKDAHADQGFTRKAESFTVPLRRCGVEPHMGLPSDELHKTRTVRFQHRDGTYDTVIEFRGMFFHKFTPKKLFRVSYEKLKPWRWVVHDRYPDGSIRFQCPFHAGNISNRQVSAPDHAKSTAQFVRVPKDAPKCCNGTFVAPPERLPRFQTPDYGSRAHQQLKGIRNPAEGGFGNIKVKDGFDEKFCRTRHLESHGLASLYVHVVHNLQLEMNEQIEEARAARKAKQGRKADAADRKQAQDPTDGSERSEPDGKEAFQEASEGTGDDEADSGDAPSPRAPP